MDEKKKDRYRRMVETNLKKDPNYYKKAGSNGGKKGKTNRPFKDRAFASKAGKISGEARRKNVFYVDN